MMSDAAKRLPDLIAGVSIAGLLLPEAVAYSGLAGLPPQAGVLALFAGLVCYGLIGRSRYAVVGATSSSAAVLAAATSSLAGTDAAQRAALASILVVGAGLSFVLAASLRLGAMSNLIARPVLRGYAFGLALTIVLKQWPQIAGIPVHNAHFVALLHEIIAGAASWHPYSIGCGLAALLVLFALERLRYVPGALAVIIAGIAASGWLQAHGVALTGPIALSLAWPSFALPDNSQWLALIELALALMFILYAESYGAIRTYALKHDDGMQANRDLLALGVANVLAGLLHGTPVGAGYSATSANEAAGARSRLAGWCAACAVLVMVLLFLPWIERIPAPVLAAIVIHAVSRSLRWAVFTPYFRWRRDRLVALTAVVFVIAFGVLDGLLAAIAFSITILLRELASPRLSELGRVGSHDFVRRDGFPHAQTIDGMLILRPEEPLFFANAEPLLTLVRERVLARPGTHCLVLSLEESPDLDSTALEALAELIAWCAAHDVELRLARVKDASRDALQRACLFVDGALDYASVDDAVRHTPAR